MPVSDESESEGSRVIKMMAFILPFTAGEVICRSEWYVSFSLCMWLSLSDFRGSSSLESMMSGMILSLDPRRQTGCPGRRLALLFLSSCLSPSACVSVFKCISAIEAIEKGAEAIAG